MSRFSLRLGNAALPAEEGTPSILAHFLERRSKRSIVNGRVYKGNGTGREPQPKEESGACRTQGEQLSRQVAHVDEIDEVDSAGYLLLFTGGADRMHSIIKGFLHTEHICLLPYGFVYALNSQPLTCSHFFTSCTMLHLSRMTTSSTPHHTTTLEAP